MKIISEGNYFIPDQCSVGWLETLFIDLFIKSISELFSPQLALLFCNDVKIKIYILLVKENI